MLSIFVWWCRWEMQTTSSQIKKKFCLKFWNEDQDNEMVLLYFLQKNYGNAISVHCNKGVTKMISVDFTQNDENGTLKGSKYGTL